jgi:hypothetical protein
MESVLTRKQVKTYGPKPISGWGTGATITAEVRYDDSCGNGHNSFAITGEIRLPGRNDIEAGGCLHDEIAKYFPELRPFLKYHLMSSDEPMHYVANTLYWLGYDSRWCDGKPSSPPNMEHARSSAVWPDMPETFLSRNGAMTRKQAEEALRSRLLALQTEFKNAVESLGFTF